MRLSAFAFQDLLTTPTPLDRAVTFTGSITPAASTYRLGGQGDLTERNQLWKNARSLPNVPSPLVYRGVLYTLKEGGILTSFDIKTGEIIKQARLTGALGDYFSSPVAADGKIYTVSDEGKAAVIQAGAQWELLQVNDLGEILSPERCGECCQRLEAGRAAIIPSQHRRHRGK